MTAKPGRDHAALTRRERQIMDILYRRGRATASEVMDDLPGNPHYSTVRTQLRVLEEKGHVTHEEQGVALRLHARPATPRRPQVGAASSGRHVLRRLGRAGCRGRARRRRREAFRGRARPHRGAGRESQERRKPMKMSLIVLGALAMTVPAAQAVGGVAALGARRRRCLLRPSVPFWRRSCLRGRCHSGRQPRSWHTKMRLERRGVSCRARESRRGCATAAAQPASRSTASFTADARRRRNALVHLGRRRRS